ncbi:MAG: hypothetical protein ABIR24_04360 [Verrucomicrobiota bacterium]
MRSIAFEIRCCKRPRSYNAPVFTRAIKVLALTFFAFALSSNGEAASARIKKVLPHFIDAQGRNSISPSLYERDAYQAFLRQNSEKRAGISFDVQWTADRKSDLILQVEMRGTTAEILKMPVRKKGLFSRWSSVALVGEDYKKFGELIAWRATLWDGDQQLAEQKSFLW